VFRSVHIGANVSRSRKIMSDQIFESEQARHLLTLTAFVFSTVSFRALCISASNNSAGLTSAPRGACLARFFMTLFLCSTAIIPFLSSSYQSRCTPRCNYNKTHMNSTPIIDLVLFNANQPILFQSPNSPNRRTSS
jgi:hypothetical protein